MCLTEENNEDQSKFCPVLMIWQVPALNDLKMIQIWAFEVLFQL